MRKYLAILAIAATAALPLAAQAQNPLAAQAQNPLAAQAQNIGSIASAKEASLAPYVNQYVYAADGSIAGILHHLQRPNQAVIAVSEFTGPAPMVAVPVAKLDVIAGKVVIHDATFASLNRAAEAE